MQEITQSFEAALKNAALNGHISNFLMEPKKILT